eukprot:gene31353-37891_t
MGAGASIASKDKAEYSYVEIGLKQLPDSVEEAIYVHEKFPVVIDPSEQAARFFKYQTGVYINSEDPLQFTKNALNRALVASMLHGRTFALRFASLEKMDESVFEPGTFPQELLDRLSFFKEEVWKSLLKPKLGDPEPEDAAISSEFTFIICTASDYIPDILKSCMHVIRVVDKSQEQEDGAGGSGDAAMDQIAAMYGANEIIRNSKDLVEAAFDGDLEALQAQIDKGYHIESVDGRKHTALSEAASQGHIHVVQYLLQHGANPNALNDTNRSPLWRATFNSHVEVVRLLLEAGSNPQFRDSVSLESAFDVAQTEELRTLLSEWDMAKTERLMEERRRIIMANLESRIKTSAERELLARNILRKELVEKAEAGDVEGIKTMLHMVADEAIKSDSKPRASVEVRNDLGQSLLSIAAQHDNEELATFLLTYYKTIDEGRWDLTEGEISAEAKVFKPNVNSRDLKGWTCACIAVFHDSRKVLRLLLEHGADPNIRSSYNKNAWDLAKDELDAAEKVIKSHADMRQILLDFEQSNASKLFSSGEVVKSSEQTNAMLYDGLDKDGSALVMNIEMNKEMHKEADDAEKKKGAGKKKGGGGGGKGGKKK